MATVVATGVASSMLSEIGGRLITKIGRQIGYFINYNNNIENLKEQADNLKLKLEGVQLTVGTAKGNGDVILPEIEWWLRSVETLLKEETSSFQQEVQQNKGCLYGWCPNVKAWYSLSTRAKEMTLRVIKLQNQGDGFKKISERARPMGIEFISNGNFRSFQSRECITQELKDIVKGGDFHMIGICGLGGVGKTTLIKEVGKWAKEEKLFDYVVMVVVSQNSVSSNIQVELAEKLGLTFTVTTFGARAGPLWNRLLQSSGRNLVILDDVWECINLNEIGIPVGDKKTTIVLTSRREEVCKGLGCNKIIRVDVLSEEEAWSLFRETAGDDTVDAPDFYLTASRVAKECGGLPIAIVTIGSALKGKQIDVWNDAHLKLSQSIMPANLLGVEAKVFQSLQISYDQVNCEDKEAGSIFLLCCLYHEDANIELEELVRLGMGRKLFQGIKLVMQARDRVHTLIEKLRKCFLLLDGDEPHTVKMHDVVRDVGIWIASQMNNFKMMHVIDGGGWPDDACQHIKCISVRSSEITELPSGGLNCPELDILHMSCESLSIEKMNAGNMLEGMNKLKVLSMFSMSISSLPSSLRLLTNLRVLNLEYNWCLTDVCSIPEELVNLEILSLRGCASIINVPREMGRLTNLRVLDMRGCPVKSISPGVISSMCRLEELYTESWLWDEEGNASLNELESLRNLTILMTEIRCSKFLPKDLVFEKLKRYYIKFGSDDFGNFSYSNISNIRNIRNYPFVEKALFLCLNDDTEAPIRLYGIGKLLKESAERVWLKGNELVIALDELAAGGFRHLKELRIRDCDNEVVEYVANYSSMAEEWVNRPNSSYGVFTKLETLDLYNMSHLKAIVSFCHDGKPGGFFGNLKEIRLWGLPELTHLWKHDPTIHPQACAIKLSSLQFVKLQGCKNLKYLFTQSEAASLENLKTLEITFCEKMEAVILGPTNNNVITLPNLKSLTIKFLNSLICFGNVIEFPQLRELELWDLSKHSYVQSIFNQKVMFPILERLSLGFMESKELWGSQDPPIFFRKLKFLSVDSLRKIVNIIPSNSAQYFSGLMELQVHFCPLLEEVFESTGVNIGRADADHLTLFTNLTQIDVMLCGRLKSLCSSSVARNLPNLNWLRISGCESMEEVIGKEEGVEEDGRIGETIFPELRKLDLYELPRLKRFCPVNSNLKLPDGLEIDMRGCPDFRREST